MISALILAAGQSTRMGRPKMVLPWDDTTVLGHVIDVFRAEDVEDVLVVSGGHRAAVEDIAARCGARTIFNPHYAEHDMLGSLQSGLRAMPSESEACLVALGDQPQLLRSTVRTLLDSFRSTAAPLIVPSYQMRRGHPWLLGRSLWEAVLQMQAPQTPRDFLRTHADRILYLRVETPTVLADLDTPEDYLKSRE